jgi:hypothetical protein
MENKILPYLIAFCALLVSGSAAFYSVYGLGKMFAGASIQVMVLAGSLEISKLVIASFLYRYWPKISGALKYYLSFATILLVLITSGGIYGFLSSAYQETATKLEMGEGQIKLLNSQKAIYEREISQIEKSIESNQGKIDKWFDKSSSNAALSRLERVEKNVNKEIKILTDSLSSKNVKISNIEKEILEIENNPEVASDIGPLKYISQVTGKTMDQIVNWFIIALMVVFDPLAIALVIAANMAFTINKKVYDKEKENSPVASLKTKENETAYPVNIDIEKEEASIFIPVTYDEEKIEDNSQEREIIEKETEKEEQVIVTQKEDIDDLLDPVENINQIIEKHLGDLNLTDGKKNFSVEVKEPEKITGESINTVNQQIDPTRIR